ISLQYVPGHRLDAPWTIDFERLFPFQRPGGKDQIGVAGRVVRMQMREKSRFEIFNFQSLHALLKRGGRAPDQPRPKIDYIRRIVNHDSDRRTRSLRVSVWRARPKHYNLGLLLDTLSGPA